jgi:hypothetical protein
MQCAMRDECRQPVTHIGEKGYVYCAEDAERRRQSGYERTRRMRVWELQLIANGQPLPSYTPQRKPQGENNG